MDGWTIAAIVFAALVASDILPMAIVLAWMALKEHKRKNRRAKPETGR